jgi:hypothetical protein
MLNHARTLLLNRDGDTAPGPEFFGEEAVPATFKELELPTYLDEIRARLFGSAPDRSMLNYRLWQFMRLLHASELESFVTDLDPRVTYVDSRRTDLAAPTSYVPNVLQLSAGIAPFHIQGDPAPPDGVGQVYHQYRVTVLSSSTVRVTQQTNPTKSDVFDYVFTSGLSDAQPLGDSGYSFMLGTDEAGAEWRVEIHNRPTFDLGSIATMFESIGEPVLIELFGLAPREPFRTFQNLWEQNKEVPMRLGGLLLATIYRTDEVLKKNG